VIPDSVTHIGCRVFSYSPNLPPFLQHCPNIDFLRAFQSGIFSHIEGFKYPISIIEGQIAIGCQTFSYEEWMGGKLLSVGVYNGYSKEEIFEFWPKLEKMYLDFMENLR
jgi:hypothetical protein